MLNLNIYTNVTLRMQDVYIRSSICCCCVTWPLLPFAMCSDFWWISICIFWITNTHTHAPCFVQRKCGWISAATSCHTHTHTHSVCLSSVLLSFYYCVPFTIWLLCFGDVCVSNARSKMVYRSIYQILIAILNRCKCKENSILYGF